MRKRVYIETTVVSYFTAQPSRDIMIAGRQAATREIWPELISEYDTYISAAVYQEVGKGAPDQTNVRLAAIKTFPMLDIDHETRALAEKIIAERGIPAKYPEDALHVAVAAVNGIEVLVTWNFAHLNNPFTRRRVRQIVESEGYVCPEVCSPEELMGIEK